MTIQLNIARVLRILAMGTLLVLVPRATWSKDLYFRGRPLPECRTFFLTEFGFRMQLAGTHLYSGEETPSYLTQWEFGLMKNMNPKYALGGTLFAMLTEDAAEFHFGFAPRLRRWLNPNFSLDFSPGVVFASTNHAFHGPGLSAGLRIGYKDYVALMASLEVMKKDTWMGAPNGATEEKTYKAFYLGAMAQSKPAVVAALATTAAVAVIGLIVVASYAGD